MLSFALASQEQSELLERACFFERSTDFSSNAQCADVIILGWLGRYLADGPESLGLADLRANLLVKAQRPE